MRNQIECPHCHSRSVWFVQDALDVILRCLCGCYQLIATQREEVTKEHIESTITLPRRASKLWYCISTLFAVEPANSQEITEALNYGKPVPLTVSDVSSQLTVLRYKGLVRALNERKGWPGGSTWCLTETAREQLGDGRNMNVDRRRRIKFILPAWIAHGSHFRRQQEQ